MVFKKHILITLSKLNGRYENADPQDSIFFSKLALLEYCGWLEESFDCIVRRSVKKKLKTIEFRQMLENRVIGKTYGFEYKQYFRPMLMQAVGLSEAEKIESFLKSNGVYEIFLGELGTVKVYRDNAAHTWIKDATITYPAPSVIMQSFNTTFPIIRSIYSYVVATR